MIKVEIYLRVDNLWAWRAVAENSAVVAGDMGQGYENLTDCERGIALVVRPDAAVYRIGSNNTRVRIGTVAEIGL